MAETCVGAVVRDLSHSADLLQSACQAASSDVSGCANRTARYLVGASMRWRFSTQTVLHQASNGRRCLVRYGENRADVDLAENVGIFARFGARSIKKVSIPD